MAFALDARAVDSRECDSEVGECCTIENKSSPQKFLSNLHFDGHSSR